MGNPSQSHGAVKFHIGHLRLLCRPHGGSALLGKCVCSFYLAYLAGGMGFREWPSLLFRVPLQQKGWKTLTYMVVVVDSETQTTKIFRYQIVIMITD